jgi:oligosaccharide translocation protein RFT1
LFYSREIGNILESKEEPDSEGQKAALKQSTGLLERLLKLQVYLALVFVCFCPFYTTPLLYYLLRGSRWMNTSAPRLLQDYLFLLPLLGLNGILEAFVQAVADERQLGRMSSALLLWSGVYCASCYLLVTAFGLREEALIFANGISMACRVAYSMVFIRKYCHRHGTSFSFSKVVSQSKAPILACGIATFVLRWSTAHFPWRTIPGFLKHVGIGLVCFLISVVVR